jgi:hypothetical protein
LPWPIVVNDNYTPGSLRLVKVQARCTGRSGKQRLHRGGDLEQPPVVPVAADQHEADRQAARPR